MGWQNLVWMLLPVAAAAGWFAARRSVAARPEAFWDYTSNFHQGLSELLNERQDKPVELFENLSDTDRDTADTHLALGNLFRRRGDVERAILLHESLLEKTGLSAEVHAAARYELARDYDSAGLLDRSEKVFLELIEQGQRVDDTYESLLQLHERERDWAKAIRVAEEHERRIGKGIPSRVAHYYCELATKAIESGYLEEARSLLGQALDNCSDCARANMMLADLALSRNDYETAIEHYRQVEQQRPELMPEIIEKRFDAFQQAGDEPRLRKFLDHIRQRRNAYSVIRTARGVIEKLDGAHEADRFFKDQILKRPSLKGLRDWARDQLEISRPEEREKVGVICAMLEQVVEDKPGYLCDSCGLRGNFMHWRCPSCGTWDSVNTIIGVEGE
ncbi:MAG: lipopolysaccharide assembly protein LapB [Granulosicoccus sp.]